MKFVAYLMIAMMIAVTTSVAAVGYFSFASTKDVLIKEIGNGQQELAHEALSIIDRTLYQKYQEIQLIADANPIEDVFILGEFTEITEQRLDEFLLQTGPWDELELFSVEGEEVSQHKQVAEKHLEGHDKEEEIAFTQALQGNVYVSDVIFSEEIKRPTIIFSAPVRDKSQADKPVIGVVVGKFSWPIIMEILDGVSLEESRIHLFNKEGMTIATPTIHKDEILEHDLTYVPIVQQALQGDCSSFLLEEEPHQEGDSHAESEEHRATLSSCTLQDGYLGFKSKGWGLVVETPQEIILEPVQQLTRRYLLVAALVILLFVPLIFLLSRRITRPITELTKSNRLIIEGKFKKAQQQKQQKNLPSEIKELMETRKIALRGLVGKSELEKANIERAKILESREMIFVNTSHELKTPITPILSQAEMLSSGNFGKLNKKQQKSVEMIKRNMLRLSGLITDILEFSSLQTGGMALNLDDYNIKKLVQEEINNIKILADNKRIKLVNKVSDETISIDIDRIKQILTNLMNNAIKFTEKGSVTIGSQKKGSFLVLSVKDTGIGISSKNIKKLFTPFTQVNPSYSLGKKGTGLGLSICRKIVEQHGGKIWIKSAGKDKGTTIYFSIPLKRKALNK